MPPPDDEVHRSSETSCLRAVLEDKAPGLHIVGISGPGGVGKSFLLRHALEALEPELHGYLVLSADASSPDTRHDFFGVVEGQLFRASLPPPADPRRDYFPHLRDVAQIHRAVVDKALTEVTRTGAPAAVQSAAALLLGTGRILNKTHPQTQLIFPAANVESAEVESALDDAWKLLRGLRDLRESTTLFGPLRDLLGISRRNQIKRDLFGVTACEVRTDLSAALVGYEAKDALLKTTQARVAGIDRLLLVLDDYEVLEGLLGDFLVGALVPELSTAPFRTVLIILGRDELESTHPGWSQHCRRFLREQIRVAPFDEEGANALFAEAGIAPSRWPGLFRATQGFPFLIHLALEEESATGADSVTFLRRFFDRTTRWMTEREREWFSRVCYLERVDEDSLRWMFPEESSRVIAQIQSWFEREPSIRDPAAPYFRVRPMVREKLLRFFAVRAPARHRELEALAAKAGEAGEAGAPPVVDPP
jgi:hypothetical protein